MWFQTVLEAATAGRGTVDMTRAVADTVRHSGILTGLCHVFNRHTSASLMLCENADPAVRRDLETFIGDLVPDGDRRYSHRDEGPDDMSAHVRTLLTHSDLTIPVAEGRLMLGTWQGIYLWEHRTAPHRRTLVVTVSGSREQGNPSPPG